jgi:hypothetical protein
MIIAKTGDNTLSLCMIDQGTKLGFNASQKLCKIQINKHAMSLTHAQEVGRKSHSAKLIPTRGGLNNS